MTTNNDTTPIRVTSPECMLSYPHLFEPTKVNKDNAGEKAKYSGCFVFAPGTDLSQLHSAAIEAGERKWGGKFKSMLEAGELRMPFRKDAVEKGYEEGSIFINARNESKPGLVMPFKDQATGKPAVVTDPEIMYPGCRVRVSLVAFGYDTMGNKGVSFSLANVQWLGDGDRLDSRVAAADDFDVVEGSEAPGEVAASVADLL